MKNVIIILLLSVGISGYSQIINFSDDDFRIALVNYYCVDTNNDGVGDAKADLNFDNEISISEALQIKYLLIFAKDIDNLSEINLFTSLISLNCSYNRITTLDVQALTKLTDLNCNANRIVKLNIKGLQGLKNLMFKGNLIKSIDIQEFTNLKSFICGHNDLNTINFGGLTNLEVISCENNQFKSLNLKGLTNLKNLVCSSNQLTDLNIEGALNLESIYCNENQLKLLDLKAFTKLKTLNCKKNDITELKIEALISLETVYCDHNELSSINLQGLTNLKNLTFTFNTLFEINLSDLHNLEWLDCSYSLLNSLDVNELKGLKDLWCKGNNLKALDLSTLTNLNSLNCNTSKITSLNLKGLNKLTKLECNYNELSTLDIQELESLEYLDCQSNQLTSLNVDDLNALTYLNCESNDIKFINVRKAKNLTMLYCGYNDITTLDVQRMKKLTQLSCKSTSLVYLLMKETYIELENLDLNPNESLRYVCCDEDRINSVKNMVRLISSCEVNSYCSFTTFGRANIIQGQNVYDTDNNGCDDHDIKISNFKYKLNNSSFFGNILGTFVSDSTGNFHIPLLEGTHTITPILEHPSRFKVTPTSYTVTFPSTSDTITQDFCITPKGIFRQTNITVIPLTPPARPGFDASYKIVWENVGNQVENGTLNFTYDETLLDYISATQTADQIADGIVKWNFINLLPFEKREIIVSLKVNRPTDTPAVNAGDKLYLTASILDNIFTLENTVVASYDPNDKTCLQGDRVKPDMVGEYVDYLIRFENTGNYAAENVVVKDIIDTKTFDISTLKITDASHEVYTRIEGNKVEFIFENIQLPFDDANNDGYIAFKIKTLPSLVLGDSLKNLADIYFDYNFPIRTNEAQTTVAFPVFTKDITSEVNIYPNPVSDILYLDTNENWTKADIYDIAGRIIRSIILDSSYMDVSGLESGTYFIRLKDREKVGIVKFLKI